MESYFNIGVYVSVVIASTIVIKWSMRSVDEKPDKNKFSHPHDALQYLCLRVLTAIAREKNSGHTYAPLQVADMRTGY